MATQQQLGVPAIYSSDPHLRRMGAPLVSGRIDDDLRNYARSMSVTVGVSLGSGIVISVAGPNILRALKATIDWLFQQPLFVQLPLAALLASLLRSEKVRSWVSETWDEHWPVAFFKKHEIMCLIFTDDDLNDTQTIFAEFILPCLEAEKPKTQLSFQMMEELLAD